MGLDALEWVRGIAWLCQHHHFPKVTQYEAKKTCNFSGRGKEEPMSKYVASTAVRDIIKETHLSLAADRV